MEIVPVSLKSGEDAYLSGNYAGARTDLLPLATKGDRTAQYYIGLMFYRGHGLPEDNTEAFRWLHKSAEQGLPQAESLLGVLYSQGKGTKRDEVQAVHWFTRAAERGDSMGQSKLAMCHFLGAGIAPDHVAAYMWFELAVAHSTGNDQKCCMDLRDTFVGTKLTAEQIAQAREKAHDWKAKRSPLLQLLHIA